MLEFFDFDKKFRTFACRDLEKKIRRREAGTTKKIFFGKITHVFGDPPKKGWVIHFLKEFLHFEIFFEKKFGKRKAGTTEGGNDGNRERLE
jgi:hypothetical protein